MPNWFLAHIEVLKLPTSQGYIGWLSDSMESIPGLVIQF